MTQWGEFKEPEIVQGDTYKAQEHYGATIVVKVKQRKEGIITDFTPDPGGPGVIVDLFDLKDDKVYRDVLWMGGKMVDDLTPYIGHMLVIKIDERKSKSRPGSYPAPAGVDPDTQTRAQKRYAEKGEPLAAELGTMSKSDDPPF